MIDFKLGVEFAKEMDAKDELRGYKDRFYLAEGELYLDGNSLGACSKDAEKSLLNMLEVWKKEKNGDFEVGFKQGKEEMSVVYNNQGKLLEVETEMAVTSLPAAVQAALKGKKIKEAAKIVKGGKTYYEAEVGGKDLLFTADGKMVSEMKD